MINVSCDEMEVFLPLKSFIGHRVLIEKSDEVSFTFEKFAIDLETYLNVAIILDENNTLHRLYIPTFGLDGLIESNKDDIFDNIIEIDSTHYNWSLSIDEQPPAIICCDKCKKEFDTFTEPWILKQRAGYGSIYDGEEINIKLCNYCMQSIFGDIISKDGDLHE
jgi:hypothetical protein